jgi:hypothetical protein
LPKRALGAPLGFALLVGGGPTPEAHQRPAPPQLLQVYVGGQTMNLLGGPEAGPLAPRNAIVPPDGR